MYIYIYIQTIYVYTDTHTNYVIVYYIILYYIILYYSTACYIHELAAHASRGSEAEAYKRGRIKQQNNNIEYNC